MVARPRPAIVASGSALAVFAFWLVWYVGHRGLFLLDHSIVFDGGYRVYLGQVPYRDFYMAYLPGALWFQALFFWIYGVDYSAMVLSAAVLNVAGTLAAMRICWKLYPGRVLVSIVTGMLTAVWFQTPFGSLQHEQLGFAFTLLALLALMETDGRCQRDWLLHCLSGVLVGAAVLSKQNAGFLFVPVLTVVIVLQSFPSLKRMTSGLVVFFAGVLSVAVAFLTWVFWFSDWQLFRVHALVIPAEFGLGRLVGDPRRLLGAFMFARRPIAVYPFEVFASLISLMFLVLSFLNSSLEEGRRRRMRLASYLTLGLLLYQNLFALSALNEWQNSVPFLGLCFGLTSAAAGEWLMNGRVEVCLNATDEGIRFALQPRLINVLVGGLLSCFLFGYTVYGLSVDFRRIVQQFSPGTQFRERLQVPRASRLIWGEPTEVQSFRLHRSDFEGLVRYLSHRKSNFFVSPDGTILYGLTGHVPPQPMLYFWLNHSYRVVDIPRLDSAILRALEANDVRIFIREKVAFENRQELLRRFPRTWEWLELSFRPVREFGLFEVWERP